MTFITKTNSVIIGGLESFFYRWGKFVSRHPYPVILTSTVVTVLCSLGFLVFRMEHQANLLWIPLESDYNVKQEWLDNNFNSNSRDEIMLFGSENVLTPESLKEMYQVYKKISNIVVNGKTFDDICEKVPIADIFQTKRRRKREVQEISQSGDYREGKGIIISDLPLTVNQSSDISSYGDDYVDFWGGEYDEYAEYEENEKSFVKPRINFEKYGKKARQVGVESDHSDTLDKLPNNIYCDLVRTLNSKCIKTSILEMWRYDETLINSATQNEIIDAVNLLEKSPWYGYGTNYSKLLGGITRNSSGHVISATVAQMFWRIEVPDGAEIVDSQGSGLELQLADQDSLEWEEQFIQVGINSTSKTATVLPNASKSFGEVSTQAIFFDAFFMAGGYLIMFLYTILMLGNLNTLELRMFLTISGLASIGMGIAISVGLSSLLGFPYTPMHAVLPFICLGIGIDDMFVIVQCWSNINKDSSSSAMGTPEKIGLTLKHAGVSVTVTSVTDVFAFGVGAVTKMPGLQSFCVCTAIALGCIYLLQVSWFVAWLVLDEKRIQSGRDGLFPCIVHKDFQASECSRKDRGEIFVKHYIEVLSHKMYKIIVLALTLVFVGCGIWGSVLIRQKFEPELLLPADSYMRQWKDLHDVSYPENGWSAEVYTGHVNYTHIENFDKLSKSLEDIRDIGLYVKDVESWWTSLKKYAKEKTNYTTWQDLADPDIFPMVLSDFLFDSTGSSYKANFRFDDELVCNQPAPKILATKFRFAYLLFDGPEEHIPARQTVEKLIKDAGIPDSFSFVKIYAAWETDEIIGYELWRNIGLAMTAIFVIVLILLANLRICLMVLLTVVLTLVDIIGFLHFWNITIDIISCVNIVLAIGLCVDYSVHIGHAFLVASGGRKAKTEEALLTIGPAVFNGGLTTFLALVLLGFSTSHVFISFFKVFVLTVLFGLFHGLVLFPVMLSVAGPVTNVINPEETASIDNSNRSTISAAGSANYGSSNAPQGIINTLFISDEEKQNSVLDQPWQNGAVSRTA